MNAKLPPTPGLDYAFTIAIELVPVRRIAPTAMGDTQRPDRVIDFVARYLPEADDGATIYLQNRGYRRARTPEIAEQMAQRKPVDAADNHMRVSPGFEAPAGPHELLTKHVFSGVAEKLPTSNCIHCFQVL